MPDSRHLFTRHRTDLPPPEKPTEARKLLDKVFQDLADEYEQNQSALSELQLVCDFSSNNLTLQHLQQFTEWLEGSSLELFALDLSMNYIESPTWQPILDLIQRLCSRVHLVDLGGNYLPALEETVELKKVQQTRRVSLHLPGLDSHVTDWQREWTSIALEFGQKAYDPVCEDRSALTMLAFDQPCLHHDNHYCTTGQVKALSTGNTICLGMIEHCPWPRVSAQVPG